MLANNAASIGRVNQIVFDASGWKQMDFAVANEDNANASVIKT